MSILAAIVAFLMMGIPETIEISGRVLDHFGKPVANARVRYTHEEKGRVFKFKTDQNGEFVGTVLNPGVYKIEITGPDGTRLYRTRRRIVDRFTFGYKKDTNILNADLSMISMTDLPAAGVKANVSPGEDKLSPEQKKAIRSHNISVDKMNKLIVRLHTALKAQDWPAATDILKQLVTADPNRWEFYQNLGAAQSNQSLYEEAAASYERAIELAQSGITNGPLPTQEDISLMMIYAGDAYSQLEKYDKAVSWYSKAAEISPEPATAYFNICRADRITGNVDAATQACNKAIAVDPNRWQVYQELAAMQQDTDQDQIAIQTYEKGIQAAKTFMAANANAVLARTAVGQMLSAEGNVYLHMKKLDEAVGAFSRAAELDAYPARDYFNTCAAFYNADHMDAAVSACDKAIASDPKMADAYFVKASALYGQSRSERGRLAVSAETQDSLRKYLELAPQGGHAADARDMLAKIGSAVGPTSSPQPK